MSATYTPQPGDIGLTQVHGRVGIGIRVGQWLNGQGFADFEHAFVFIGGDGIIEAEPGGAVQSSLSRYDPARVAWLRCPAQHRLAVALAATKYKGVPYSFLDYGAVAAHRLHLPVPLLRRYIGDSQHMICSQLADQAAMDGGWHLFGDGRWPGYVTPAALWQLYARQVESA